MLTRVCFKLPSKYAEGAQQVVLVGEFNDWKIEKGIALKKEPDGSMVTEINLAGGRTYQYRYYLGNGQWVNDDNCKTSTVAYGMKVENCLIEVPQLAVITEKAVSENVPLKKVRRKKTPQDDLTQILGITAIIAKAMNKNGIFTYNHLSKCTMKRLLLLLTEENLIHKSRHLTSWTRQAKLISSGNLEAWEEIKNAIR